MTIHDARGGILRRLTAGGSGSIPFDGLDDRGAPLPGGIYFVRVETATRVMTTKSCSNRSGSPAGAGDPGGCMTRIGLALGGGGVRGFAHIPVLELLDELG